VVDDQASSAIRPAKKSGVLTPRYENCIDVVVVVMICCNSRLLDVVTIISIQSGDFLSLRSGFSIAGFVC
jgi:hypothetical protein